MFSKTKLQNLLSLSAESDVNSRLKSFLQPCINVIFTSTWTLRMITVAELSRKSSQCIGTSQVTLNPAVVHYKNGEEVKHKSYVFLLPESRHDANFVYAILKELANYVHYWMDSPTSQYRNKTIFNVVAAHKELFSYPFSWNCMESGPGKSSCNPIGGVAKRIADLSVKNKKTVIEDAEDFYTWARKEKTPMIYKMRTCQDYER